MDELINIDERNAESAALNHEIYELTKRLNEKEKECAALMTADPADPFNNPTEYKGFGGDYTKIQPRLGISGYKLPLEPDHAEKKAVRRYYSIGGWCMIFQFLMSFGASVVLMNIIMAVLQILYPEAGFNALYDYMRGSSILVALNMIVYLFCNVFNAFIGMKWAGVKASSLIHTKDFSAAKAVQYCFAALFIWVVSIYAATAIGDVFSKYGIDTMVDQSGLGESTMGFVTTIIYTCIIAPITEELLFRGMLLRVFSKANQRFAMIATAFFFGLAHGNIPQFLLAFLLGVFLAHITMKHDSIVPGIIVHMFINSFSTVFSYLTGASSIVLIMATLALFAAAILGMIMLLVFHGENKIPTTTPEQSRRGLAIASGSIPFIAAVVIEVIYMIYVLTAN